MSRSARMIAMACMCCAIPVAAAAQPDVRANEWSHGTTLNGSVGITADSSQTGPALGGGMGWEVTPTVAIEGSGSWAEFGHGTTSFAGALKVRLRLAGRRHVDPFVQAGVGLYRATFGTDDGDVPGFYRRRIAAAISGHGDRTFTDPTIVGGGGVSIFVNRHFAVRPDVEAAFVFRDGRTHVVTTAALHAVYHFESHPVTPARVR
jgi:hypothetical protein